jgi:hypothetical protein
MRLGFRQERIAAIEHEAAARERARVERLEREAVAGQLQRIGREVRRHVAERSRDLAEMLARMRGGVALERGEIIDGRYRVERLLGEGGMGRVYHVTRLADARPFALKVMARTARETALPRFAREMAVAAQLDHPNIVAWSIWARCKSARRSSSCS